jgi:DNA modification methylase
MDAFERTSRYDKKGKERLFIEKFNYIKACYQKLIEIKNKYGLEFKRAEIVEGDVLELKKYEEYESRFDAIITSPPYYFSIDYVGKDKVAYEYLGVNMKKIESKYLGMKNSISHGTTYGNLPYKVILYYKDLRKSIENMYWALKNGGRMAIIIGDSTVSGRKIPTTMITKKFCEKVGFEFRKLIFNPLLGARNRAIRGESIIMCDKRM